MRSSVYFLLTLAAFSGCGKEEPIEVHEYPSNSRTEVRASRQGLPGGLRYRLPEGWKDEGAKGMRAATLVAEKNGRKGEITLIALGPQAADIRMNVERWCRQVAATFPEKDEIRERPVAGSTATLVDLRGKRGRILGAILPLTGACWFFKMTSPRPEQLDPFVKDFVMILDSVHFGEGGASDGR